MEACLAVERDIDKVISKFDEISTQTSSQLDELLTFVNNLKKELEEQNASDEVSTALYISLTEGIKKIKGTISQLSSDHKDLHGSVSKVGKSIDRHFISDFSSVLTDNDFHGPEKKPLINYVICEHFLRQGMLDIAEHLIKESNLQIDYEQKEPFLELHRILEALKIKNLQPALRWTHANREKLAQQNSSLEFKLHRLQFIELVRQGSNQQMAALHYARNFEPFANSHAKELQVLMGTLLYLHQGLENSPYSYLLDPIHWLDLCELFTRDACALLGLSVESPLSVAIRAGCTALPPLLTIKQVMQQRQCTGVWNSKDELPVEIDLGEECRFHSIFACPILRQQSNESNPPVRLVCGHVISKDALNKLANGNKVKCPYCPMEQSPSEARQIHF